jgi:hypothetical protein
MSTQSHLDKVNLKTNILPHPYHVGSPVIKKDNIIEFKELGVNKADKYIKKKYNELLNEAENLQKSYFLNLEVYGSKYNFEPKMGLVYHLYENDDGIKFLSLIAPNEWKSKKFLYSVVLNSEMIWEKI